MEKNTRNIEKKPLQDDMDFVDIALFNPPTEWEESPFVFYCKDCKKIIPLNDPEKPLLKICPHCQSKNLVSGTLRSLQKFYNINS